MPLHAPVLFDGRGVTGIALHASYADVSVVSFSGYAAKTASLVGREFRVVKSAATSAAEVYLAGTVTANMGNVLHIHDPGGAIKDAWSSLDRELSAVFDLHEGFVKGVVDSKSTGTWSFNGWHSPQPVSCFLSKAVLRPGTIASRTLHVDLAPFQTWMFSPKSSSEYLTVTLVGPSGQTLPGVTVLGVDDATPDQQAHHKLVVKGDSLPAWVDAGCWFPSRKQCFRSGTVAARPIDGRTYKQNVAQSGIWAAAASGSSTTTFTVTSASTTNPKPAALTPTMVGWILQPDINQQVYLPVTGVTPSNGTLTVAGDYASLGQTGKRWRLYAPPGVETYTQHAGTLSQWVSAVDSRCLFAGYRYESPLAGIWDGSAAQHRQTGKNFAGQHYTLFRHYDPVLMRFTSPDPIASPFYNLFHYAGNSPARLFDPDGLEGVEFTFKGYWGRVKNIFTKGEFEFKLGTDGYSERAEATWEGAAVKTFDTLTLGQVLDDNDRAAMAYKWQSRGLGGYYDAGGFVGSTTVLTALSIATAGAFSGVGATGAVANIGLRSWMAGGAIAGAYGGASDAGIAGGGAAEMLQGAAIGAVIGAGSELLGAVGGRLISRGLHKIGDKLLGKVTPHGFVNSSDFANFTRIFNRGMKKAGYADAKGFLQGSAVTGRSFPRPGRPSQGFDIGRVSDFDVAVASPTLLARAQAAGVPLRTGGIRTAKLWPGNLRALNLDKLQSQLSRYARRRVDVMIYKDAPSVMSMQRPSIPLRR